MKKLTFIYLGIVIAALCSCNGRKMMAQLDEISKIADDNPDSALTLLSKFDTDKNEWGKGDRMHYELIRLKAENQNITSSDKAFSVISSSKEQSIGKAKIPVAGSGKVKIGQRVNIQLDGYPYLEYGFLTGCITSVALMPDEDIYTATFELQNSQTTSYGKAIRQTGDLSGVGEIITDDLSVAERIIGPLKYLFHRNLRN